MAQAEFRGCDNLVCARVLQDDADGYVVGEVTVVAPVASVAKTTEQNSETHFYDNVGMINIKAIGTDTVTLVVPALYLEKLALVTGAMIDPATGAYMSGEDTNYDYALGYRLKLTDGTYRYVWRLKGNFSNVPDEQSDTESNDINTNNQTVNFTGTQTVYQFSNGGRRRDVVIDERDGKCDLTNFFTTVRTPDNIADLALSSVTTLSISPGGLSLAPGGSQTFVTSVVPADAAVTWVSSNPRVAVVDSTGKVTAVAEGTSVVTATAGMKAVSATVTVAEE